MSGIRGERRPAEAAQQLGDRPQAGTPPVRDRPVDRDAVDPCFGRGVGAPALPRLERLDESVLGAVLSFVGVAKDRGKISVDTRIRAPVKAIQCLARSWLVRLLPPVRQRWRAGYYAGGYPARWND